MTCGSVVKIANVESSDRLHSHDVKYGSGSGQQVCVCGWVGGWVGGCACACVRACVCVCVCACACACVSKHKRVSLPKAHTSVAWYID